MCDLEIRLQSTRSEHTTELVICTTKRDPEKITKDETHRRQKEQRFKSFATVKQQGAEAAGNRARVAPVFGPPIHQAPFPA